MPFLPFVALAASVKPLVLATKSKSKRAELQKADYFKCRNKRKAKGKKVWPDKGAKKIGTCRATYVKWQKLDPKAAKEVDEGGVSSVYSAGNAKKAAKRKTKYLKCKRKWTARDKDAYPKHKKWPYRCKSEYLSWKKVSAQNEPEYVIESSGKTVGGTRRTSSVVPHIAREAVLRKARNRAARARGEFVPSSAEDMVEEEVFFESANSDIDSDINLEESEGVPMWVWAAGGLAVVASGAWYISKR